MTVEREPLRELLNVVRDMSDEITALKTRVNELEALPRQVVLDGSCPAEVVEFMEGIQDGMVRVEHKLANLKGHVCAIDERSGSK